MPMYEYYCLDCEATFVKICKWPPPIKIECQVCCRVDSKGKFTASYATRIISQIAKPITDSDWALTGTVDKRVGGPPIQSRKDWDNRLKEKQLVPLTQHEFNNMDEFDKNKGDPAKEIRKAFDEA